MEVSLKTMALAVILTGGVSFAAGRSSAPEKVVTKVETKVEIKEVVKWKTKTVKSENKNKQTIIIETKLPDGTFKKETHILDKGTVVLDKSKDLEKDITTAESSKKEQTKELELSNWKLSGIAYLEPNLEVSKTGISWGLLVERRVVGPIYVGLFGITNGSLGASLGVSF